MDGSKRLRFAVDQTLGVRRFMGWLNGRFIVMLFCVWAPCVHADRIGDIVETTIFEQALRFFTFSDPSLRYALVGAILLGISCGVLGSFIVVRKMALMGDTLSHAVLPGVAAGFLWSETKDPVAILVGATVVGLLATVLVSLIRQTTKIKEDAALGLVLASFFGVGICMLTRIQKLPNGNQSGIDKFMFGQAAALTQQDVTLMFATTVLTIILIVLFYKGLLAMSFDPAFAVSIGLPVKAIHYMLMALLAFAIVVSLQAVGVVLVSAMLITPAASAYLLTDRMKHMLVLSAIFGMLAGAIGAFLSFLGNNLPTGPFMVIGASVVFVLAYFFAPKHGVLTRWYRHLRRRQRVRMENMLKAMHRVMEDRDFHGEGVSVKELATLRRETLEDITRTVQEMVRNKYVTLGEAGNMVYFTPESFNHACRIVRNHRLWELYLTNEVDYQADHVHEDAEKIEHVLGEEIVRKLERALDYPKTDPHGKKIPEVRDMSGLPQEIATGYGKGRN